MFLVQNPILVVLFGCSITGTGVRHTCAIPLGHYAIPERRIWDPPSILLVPFGRSLGNLLGVLLAPPGSLLEDTLVRSGRAQAPWNDI